MLAELTLLMASCAPDVSPVTLQALVQHESSTNAYAIGINSSARLKEQPRDAASAQKVVKDLLEKEVDFDAGLGQINVRNWAWLGLDEQSVFDPCLNLKAAQTVLADCYARASKQFADEQKALQAALSCYNTGNFEKGFSNGYVGKVLAQAGIKVPALKAPQPSKKQSQSDRQQGRGNDGFGRTNTVDGFKQQSSRTTQKLKKSASTAPVIFLPADS